MRNPNGYGSVVKLGSNRRKPFAIRITTGWTDEGKQKYKYIGYFEKQKDAIIALAEFNKNPFDIDKTSITFEQVFYDWRDRKFKKVSKHSVRNYNSIFNKCTALYKIPFRDIRTRHLQDVIDEYDGTAAATLLKVLFGQLYIFAQQKEICHTDYSKFIETTKQEKKKEKTPFTTEEIHTIWKHIDTYPSEIVLILLYSGMRISELLELKIENIHLDKNYMIGGKKTKAGMNRIIPIHKKIMPIVKKNYSKDKTYLFESSRGNLIAYNYFAAHKFAPFMEKLNMDHTLHETRHTFISQADRLNINKTLIKRIVGHSTGDITDHYTHKDFDELVSAMNDFNY